MKKTLSFLFILFLISSTAYATGPMAFPQDLRTIASPTFNGLTSTGTTVVPDPANPDEAVNLRTLVQTVGSNLSYWPQASNIMSSTFVDSEAERTELITSNPQTLSTIYYKSAAGDTPSPFVIKSGTIVFIHANAKVDTTVVGKTVTLRAELYYVDADGTSNATQIGDTSDATDNLTTSKIHYDMHIHVDADTTVPAGKRLWLKFVVTPSTLTGYSPTVSIYDGETTDQLSVPSAGIPASGIYAPFTIPEVDGHTDATVLTAANCSGASITSYGRTGAATLTLPAAAVGLNCIFDVGTQHNSAWKIQRAGSDTITKDGNTGKTYFQEVNQVVTSSIACRTTKTGASTYTWVCITGGGTWTTD